MAEHFEDWRSVPGNEGAWERWLEILRSGSAVAFVGAGASSPAYPLWGGLLRVLMDVAVAEGRITEAERSAYDGLAADQATHVADELRDRLGPGLTRHEIAKTFSPSRGFTPTHSRLAELPFLGYVTTNYDLGLSLARAELGEPDVPIPFTWRSPDARRWFLSAGDPTNTGRPILHLHGLPSDPDSLILSESQYQAAYSDPRVQSFLEALWTQTALVFVGFSFTDPWIGALSRIALARTRQTETDEPKHVAILGLRPADHETVSLRRRAMQRELHSRILFYPLHETDEGTWSHAELGRLLEEARDTLSFGATPSRPQRNLSHSTATPSDTPALPSPEAKLPFLRIELQRLGECHYGMEIEARLDESSDVKRLGRQFPLPALGVEDLSEWLFQKGQTQKLFRELGDLRSLGKTLRVQLTLAAAERSLDRIAWEEVEWNGEKLGSSPHLIFSRRFLFVGGDPSPLKINSSQDLDFSIVDVPQQPAEEEADRAWLFPCRLAPETRSAFDYLCQWDGEDSIDLDIIRRELERSEVAYVRLPLGIRGQAPSSDAKIPLPTGPGSRLRASDFEQLLSLMRVLGESGPAVVILPTMRFGEEEGCPPQLLHLAADLARTGISAVISPVGDGWPLGLWDSTVRKIVDGLRGHGVIDLAVAAARRNLPDPLQIRLYLRSKSGRLYYRPGLVAVREPKIGPSWEALGDVFSGSEVSQCVVLVGPGFDPELNWSRRRIAKTLAMQHGFSLSRRDMEDLAKVAEYIRVSQPHRGEPVGPHVSAFIDCTKGYLLKHPLARKSGLTESDDIETITDYVGEERLKAPGSPYLDLAELRVKQYLTPSFHGILEQALLARDRWPISTSFSRRSDPSEAEKAAGLNISRPLVYHCFGTFSRPNSLLLSETDFLEFFAAFCREDDPLTQIVRGNLVDASLLILGFNPNSWDFKLLFSAIRSMRGRKLSQRRVHIAVQVDPEDDHTIDPDGARNFYRGLLSELGSEGVFLYWGRSTQFLTDLRRNVPGAFEEDRP